MLLLISIINISHVCLYIGYIYLCGHVLLKDMRTIKFAHKQEGHSRRGAYERLQVSGNMQFMYTVTIGCDDYCKYVIFLDCGISCQLWKGMYA